MKRHPLFERAIHNLHRLGPVPGADAVLGEIESNVYNNIRPVRADDVVIDVGAHVGFYTLDAIRRGASFVYSLEPDELNYKVLCANVDGLHVQCANVAAWHHCGQFILQRSRGSFAHSLVFTPSEPAGQVMVDTCALDTLFDHLTKVDVLKIDVEGAEANVIRGAMALIKRCRPHLVIEIHGEDLVRHVKEFLEPIGYRFKNATAPGVYDATLA